MIEVKVTKSKVYAPDLAIAGALTNLVDQTLLRLERGDKDSIDIVDAIFFAPDEDGPIIHANLGSNGELLIETVRRHVASVVKVVMVLAVAYTAHDIYGMVMNGELTLSNSQGLIGGEHGELAQTQERLYDFVRSTGRDNLEQIVDLIRESHSRIGAELDAAISDAR